MEVCHNKVWQSQVENEHHSVSMKIEFSTCINALGHCLCGSRLLAPLRMCTSYGLRNTAHFGIAGNCNYCRVSKDQQKRSRQGAVRVLGGLFVGCLLSEELR